MVVCGLFKGLGQLFLKPAFVMYLMFFFMLLYIIDIKIETFQKRVAQNCFRPRVFGTRKRNAGYTSIYKYLWRVSAPPGTRQKPRACRG